MQVTVTTRQTAKETEKEEKGIERNEMKRVGIRTMTYGRHSCWKSAARPAACLESSSSTVPSFPALKHSPRLPQTGLERY